MGEYKEYRETIDGYTIKIEDYEDDNLIRITDGRNSYQTLFHYDDIDKMLKYYNEIKDYRCDEVHTGNVCYDYKFSKISRYTGNYVKCKRVKYYIDILTKYIELDIDKLMEYLDSLNTIQLTKLYKAILKRKEKRDETSSIGRTESIAS